MLICQTQACNYVGTRQKQHIRALTLTWSRDNSTINIFSWKWQFAARQTVGKSQVGLTSSL